MERVGSSVPDLGESDGARLDVLDALRGFALCGILLINLPHMAWLIEGSTPLPGTGPGTFSGGLWWVQMVFVEGTMRGLFSLLFGASMILFMTKSERGAVSVEDTRRLMRRRLFWLFVFGILNATILLWPGDILMIYALAGFVVLPFWRAPPRTLAIAAATVILVLSIWMAWQQLPKQEFLEQGRQLEARAATGSLLPAEQGEFEEWKDWKTNRVAAPAAIERERSIRLGSYPANFSFLAETSWAWFWDLPATLRWILDAIGFMLVGMLLLKLGWLQGSAPARTYWMLVLVGYGLGIPLKAVEAAAAWILYVEFGEPEFWHFMLPALVKQPARLLVTLGHLGLFLLLWRKLAPFRSLQALGRMAFTNYLLQSALAALAFSGFGLGLWGSLNLAEIWIAAGIIWTIQIIVSRLWLSRFPMGPLERAWRRLTYSKWRPRLEAPT